MAHTGLRHCIMGPIITFISPTIRTIGGHTRRKHTCLSFPMGRVGVCPSCHRGPSRLTTVGRAISMIGGSIGAAVARVTVINCTSPRNECTTGTHLTRKHTRTLGDCMVGRCNFGTSLFGIGSMPRS